LLKGEKMKKAKKCGDCQHFFESKMIDNTIFGYCRKNDLNSEELLNENEPACLLDFLEKNKKE